MSLKQNASDTKPCRHVLVSRNCIALVLSRTKADAFSALQDGHVAFADFLQQNSMCFWNTCLIRSVASLEYRGCLMPSTLLVSGTNFALEVVRSAWARRVLRPPKGFTITKLGDVGGVDMLPVAQTQFAPLSEALCKVVTDLNVDHEVATTDSIRTRLENSFPEMQIPCEDILHKTLGGLIRERKIYHAGNGYFVVSPDTYRQRATSPLCERQMLMTNEEAIVKMHGEKRRACTLAVQVDEMDIAAAWRCSTSSFLQAKLSKDVSSQFTQMPSVQDIQLLERSLRVKKGRPNSAGDGSSIEKCGSLQDTKKIGFLANELENDLNDLPKNAKQSMLAKLLKRMQFLTDKSAKHVVFSAQFPPLEWLDSEKLRCHSVATQTYHMLQKPSGSKSSTKTSEHPLELHKVPWDDSINNFSSRTQSFHPSPDAGHKRLYSDPSEISPKKNVSPPARPNNSRYSPSHRYSHGTFTNHSKRRHRHRRSSSESPKIHKNLVNGCQSHSTSSKSNADNSDDKTQTNSFNSTSQKDKRLVYKPFDQPEWKRAFNYLSKNEAQSGVNAPASSGFEREVLKNISSAPKTSNPKIENVPFKPSSVEEKDSVLKKHRPDQRSGSASNEVPPKENGHTVTGLLDDKHKDPETKLEKSLNGLCRDDLVKSKLSEPINSGKPGSKSPKVPLVLKSDVPNAKTTKISPKEIIVDNTVSVELALEKCPSPKSRSNSVSTTIVTEETTVTKANGNSKVVTVTSITTSLSHGGSEEKEPPGLGDNSPDQGFLDSESDREKLSVNDLNLESGKDAKIIDCSSSCNIVTEVN